MSEPEFSIAEELRFLAAQCDAQVASTHRDQDREFIRTLAGSLYRVGGCGLLDLISRMIADAADPLRQPSQLTGIITSRAAILREMAEALDALEQRGRAA